MRAPTGRLAKAETSEHGVYANIHSHSPGQLSKLPGEGDSEADKEDDDESRTSGVGDKQSRLINDLSSWHTSKQESALATRCQYNLQT